MQRPSLGLRGILQNIPYLFGAQSRLVAMCALHEDVAHLATDYQRPRTAKAFDPEATFSPNLLGDLRGGGIGFVQELRLWISHDMMQTDAHYTPPVVEMYRTSRVSRRSYQGCSLGQQSTTNTEHIF